MSVRIWSRWFSNVFSSEVVSLSLLLQLSPFSISLIWGFPLPSFVWSLFPSLSSFLSHLAGRETTDRVKTSTCTKEGEEREESALWGEERKREEREQKRGISGWKNVRVRTAEDELGWFIRKSSCVAISWITHLSCWAWFNEWEMNEWEVKENWDKAASHNSERSNTTCYNL